MSVDFADSVIKYDKSPLFFYCFESYNLESVASSLVGRFVQPNLQYALPIVLKNAPVLNRGLEIKTLFVTLIQLVLLRVNRALYAILLAYFVIFKYIKLNSTKNATINFVRVTLEILTITFFFHISFD